jgi:hypothetical protein
MLLVLALLVAAVVLAPSRASAGACGPGEGRITGRVTDALTLRPLAQVTSVGVQEVSGGFDDGFATNPATSRYDVCVPGGAEYTIQFFADDYRIEYWNDAPDLASADPIEVVPGSEHLGVNAALTPAGKILAGRVTNLSGRPLFASIGIWRRTSVGWRSIDGDGSDPLNGRWWARVPRSGRYRVSFAADHYHARWYDGDTRLRFARVIVVPEGQSVTTGIDVQLPYCPSSTGPPCFPAGFNS